jgi:hypothetical protein
LGNIADGDVLTVVPVCAVTPYGAPPRHLSRTV